MRSNVIVCCAAIVIPALALAQTRKPDSAASIAAASDRLSQAESRRDGAAIRELLSDDAALYPPGEAPVLGREDVARWLAQRVPGSVSHERLQASSIEVGGEYAIETGSAVAGAADVGGMTPPATQYISIWRRGPGDAWRLQKTMWTRFSSGATASAASVPAATPSPRSVSPPAGSLPVPVPPPSDYLPIPDPRSLSDGFVRTIADQIRSRAAKIRSEQGPGGNPGAARAAIAKADRELQVVIRDVGWIDVSRFGVRAACDAAFIVAVSDDPALIRSTVPRMGDLQSNPESQACYAGVFEVYEKLPSR